MTTQTFRLPDGRALAFAEYGQPDGRPLLFLHGTPGSRLFPDCLDAAARTEGVRIIAPDRPGFGRSCPDPRLSFAGYSKDLRVLLDRLELSEVTLGGISGGGGYALAAAKMLADRLNAVLLISGFLPLTGTTGPRTNRLESALTRHVPALYGLVMDRTVGAAARRGPRTLAPLLRGWPAEDRRAMNTRGALEALAADIAEALRQGSRASVQELRRYHTEPLGVPLTDIAVPVDVLHGEQDTSVPFQVATWISDQLPTATLTSYSNAAHLFSLVRPLRILCHVR